jgi:hypothetical protein
LPGDEDREFSEALEMSELDGAVKVPAEVNVGIGV